MKKLKKASFLIILLMILASTTFSQELVNREFAVVENKNFTIYEIADLSSSTVNYSRLSPALKDTFEIIDSSEEFYRIKFYAGGNRYNVGWIPISDVREKLTLGSVLSFQTELVSNAQRMETIISHPEWNAVVKCAVCNGEIVRGMNKQMVMV